VEQIITSMQSVDPILILAIVFGIAFIENVFPPSPSDLVIVVGGSLVGIGRVGFVETLLAATLGGTLGFMVMYKIGDWFGDTILEQGKIKFIPPQAVARVEEWFRKYGYWIVVANRFLAGTRAVVSFFAGMSELAVGRTIVLCFLSALAWNTMLVGGGYVMGRNWEKIGFYLTTYSQVVTGVVIVVLLVLVIKYVYRRNNGTASR